MTTRDRNLMSSCECRKEKARAMEGSSQRNVYAKCHDVTLFASIAIMESIVQSTRPDQMGIKRFSMWAVQQC